MKFSSEYADDANDLLRLKNDAYSPVSKKRERIDIVRRFTNMMNTLTPEEAEVLGESTEITNHGLSYKAMLYNQTQYQSMVTVTNSICEVIVDTDNPEVDFMLGQRISEAVNKYAFHHKGKFARFWDKVSGEFVISGGVPVTSPTKYGWLPVPQLDMFFPAETGLDPEEVPYAFSPKLLTVKDLEELLNSIKGDEGVYLDKAALTDLLKEIKRNYKEDTRTVQAYGEQITKGTRTETGLWETQIPAWYFYEVKYDDKGEQFVSSTLFVDATHAIKQKKPTSCHIISYREKAFEYACDWIQLPYVDSEIGGVKNLDTIKGVAEMQFNSAQDMEELLNLIIEGEKLRARPMFRVADQANADAIAKWDARKTIYVPDGMEEVVLRNNSNGLQGPLSILSQNQAGIAQSDGSGSSGKLRVEALESQQQMANVSTNKLSNAGNHLDSILEGCVYRLLMSDTKPGTEGYNDIMAVRAHLKKYDIDYKKLASRKYGRFQYLRVRAKRTVGNGDRQQQLETSDWLMDRIQAYQPAARPIVVHQATVLRTQDPDLADRLVKIPQSIINAQKITAENEADTIRRRSSLGQTLPVAEDDVHQDHIPIHMIDMQALIQRHAIRPWDKLDLLEFAGMTEHTMEHINILYENPDTNGEAKGFLEDFQQITESAQGIANEVQEAEEGQSGLSPKETLDMQMQSAKLQLQARQQGLKERQQDAIEEERDRNFELKRRSNLVGEVQKSREFEIKQKDENGTTKKNSGT